MVSCYLMYFLCILHQAVVGLTCISGEEDVVRWEKNAQYLWSTVRLMPCNIY